jgi:PAS domain S-box-containing protein
MDKKTLLSILEGAPDSIIIVTKGKFAWLNLAACRLLGIKSPEEVVGTGLIKHIHPDNHHAFHEKIKRATESRDSAHELLEYKITRENGCEVWVEGKAEILRYKGKESSLVFLRDITARKQWEANLKSSYNLLKIAGEVANFGGFSIYLSDNSVCWSDTVAEIHGMPAGYCPTLKEFFIFFEPASRKKAIRVFTECAQKGIPCDEELEIITNKGDRLWIRILGEAIKEDGKIVKIQGALQEITKIKQAELTIEESEAKFRNLFENHSAVKIITDPETGNIVDVNKSAARYYGWTVSRMKKKNISEIIFLPDTEIIHKPQLAGDPETHFISKHRKANGKIADVEIFSSKINIGGKEFRHSIIHDVTEKKSTEKQLNLLSRAMEQSPVSIVITGKNGKIEYMNPTFENTTGYSLGELKGKSLRILKSRLKSPGLSKDAWGALLSGKKWTGEFRSKKKNGQLFWEKLVISPIFDSRGKITNFVSIGEDITEMRKLVEDLVGAKEKAEESVRLKSAFLANISHEIRTPMNGILGFAEILRESGLSRHEKLKFLDIIRNSGNRMLDTVNDLIDISRIETGQVRMYITESDLNHHFESLYEFFVPQAVQKGLILKMHPVASPVAVIKTDHSKLDSILINLIKNAIKFTNKGIIEVGCLQKGDFFLEFYVRDTGVGVPADRQTAIFNRFEQADMADTKSFQGSGLGLAITKAYVELLGGEIWVESEPGYGSTFYFTILLRTAEAQNNKRQTICKDSPSPGIPQLKGRKILVAEDDLFSREMIIYLLKKTGATLLIAKDGRETIKEFYRETVDLILLDIQLPEIDGYEVFREVRANNPDVPVIAQTAYAMLDDIKKFNELGFTDYLTKPIDQDRLFKLLNAYLMPPCKGPATNALSDRISE